MVFISCASLFMFLSFSNKCVFSKTFELIELTSMVFISSGGEAKRLSWERQVPEGECTSCGKGFTRSLTAGRDRAQVSEKLGEYARGVA